MTQMSKSPGADVKLSLIRVQAGLDLVRGCGYNPALLGTLKTDTGPSMANHKSALKRIRRNTRREQINGDRLSRIRTYIKRVEKAIQSGDQQTAHEAFKQAQPEIHRGVTKGVLHRNSAARKISRLSSRIKRIA